MPQPQARAGSPGADPSGWVELDRCPACDDPRARELLPPGLRFDSSLEWLYERGLSERLPDVDLSPFHVARYVLCESCALVFCRRRATPEAAKTYYPRLFHAVGTKNLPFDAPRVPERYVERRSRVTSALVAILRERGLLEGVRKVLWVRCNAGEGLKLLRDEHGIEGVFGCDLLPSTVRHAREQWGLAVRPLLAPEFDNPFPGERYDLVIVNHAFTHAHDPAGIARTLPGLLAPGGRVVIYNEPDHERSFRSKRRHGINFFHKQMFTRKSFRIFLELSGFEVSELPHPTTDLAAATKNMKLCFAARPGAPARPALPSDEVELVASLFRPWWRGHLWRQRRKRILSLVRPGGGRRRGGVARLH